jgi:two-component system sensor histidine kinase DegS
MYDGGQPGRGSNGGQFGRGSDGGQPGRGGDGGQFTSSDGGQFTRSGDGSQFSRSSDGVWRSNGGVTGGLRPPNGVQESGPLNLQGLLDLVNREAERVREELEEIKLFARSNVADQEHANQRKSQATERIQEIEAKLETFSRQEIRLAYLNANEADKRVFMMNEQRERMADKQRTYERHLRAYQQIAASLQHLLDEQHAGLEPAGGTGTLARVVETQEQLRQRIAQHLHDGPAQALANVVLSAEICAQAIDHDLGRARSELANLKNAVNVTLQETRKFIFELRPMTLDDLGLIPTLRRYIADLGNKSDVELLFEVQGLEQRLPSWIEVSLFRIAQEALSNVVLHARASQAALALVIEHHQLVMTVEDNGTGFEVEEALAESAARHTVGLNSMYERAEMLGGRLVIESLPGQGTKVELVLQPPRGESRSRR